MKKHPLCATFLFATISLFVVSCDKDPGQSDPACSILHMNNSGPCYNLDVVLKGNLKEKQLGFIKFRQDPDTNRIITLKTRIENLIPNHEYLLQRAVDAANDVDGVCAGSAWLTLGKGLTSQSILTDAHGNGSEELWRDVTAAARGTSFDIHFQIIDAATLAVVLTSDCYQYSVR
jgi:hypothetical protein